MICRIQEMNHQTKRTIRVLAGKYHHTIGYEKEVLRLEGVVNSIAIEPTHKDLFTVQYNAPLGTESLAVPNDEIYDVLLALLRRKEASVIGRKAGNLITLDLYRLEEGAIVDQWLTQLKIETNTRGITHKKLGGNRIEAEYYQGLLILTDDLVFYASNVIELSVIELEK